MNNFPWPLLSTESLDYKSSIKIITEYNFDDFSKNNCIKIKLNTNSTFINKLLSDNLAELIIKIEQKAIRYTINSLKINDFNSIEINSNKFSPNNNIKIIPMIVMKENYNLKYNNDFSEIFNEIEIDLYKGSVICFGEVKEIKNNLVESKLSEIIRISLKKEIKVPYEIFIDNDIVIYVNEELNQLYATTKHKFKISTVMLFELAIKKAIFRLLCCEGDESKVWYNILLEKIEELTDVNVEKIKNDFADNKRNGLFNLDEVYEKTEEITIKLLSEYIVESYKELDTYDDSK